MQSAVTLCPALLACALLAACGSTPQSPDAGDTDAPDAGDTASPDAGDTEVPDAGGEDTPDAGGGPTTAYVRFAFFNAVPVAERTTFAVKLDDAEIETGLNAAILATQDSYFLPGSTERWRELPIGEHTVKLDATSFQRLCNDPGCTDFFDETYTNNQTKTFTAKAGEHWTIVGMHRLKNDSPIPEQPSLSPETHLVALEGGPNGTDKFVSVFRWPASMDDHNDWTVSARTNVPETVATQVTLAPGSGVVVKLPADPVRLTVQTMGPRGQLVTRMIDLPTNISTEDVYPTLWLTNAPQGPMLATGAGGTFPLVQLP